jgi:hypothetical protein
MGQYKNYITFSVLLGITYAVGGHYLFRVQPEIGLLASVVILIAGLLPEIDAGPGPANRELGGLLAAIAPLVLIELFPRFAMGGTSRIALVVICCYIVTRIIVSRLLIKITAPKGIIHSIPAAVLTFEVVYLLFGDLYRGDRLFVATAALVGYLGHLTVDAYSSLDLLGKAIGDSKKGASYFKFTGKTTGATIAVFCSSGGMSLRISTPG